MPKDHASRIRILIVEDSPLQGLLLKHVLETHADLEVVGISRDGEDALRLVRVLDPDLITMDVRMPRMDGLQATRAIMESSPRPILVVAESVNSLTVAAQEMLGAGALDVFQKPLGLDGWEAAADALAKRVRTLARVPITPRTGRPLRSATQEEGALAPRARPHIIAIVASTGGPPALLRLFGALAHDYPVPVLVVQHIAPGFGVGLTQWLAAACPLPVRLAEQQAFADHIGVTVAPDDQHVTVGTDHRLQLSGSAPIGSLRPRADLLLTSVAQVYGSEAVGIVLTGMGNDGARGLHEMRKAGALTIAQDEASSVVYGMPKAAHELGAAELVLGIEDISALLLRFAGE